MRQRFSALVVTLAFAPAAIAHSPYLLPNAFDVTQRDHVTVQASFTEELFIPDVVMKSDAYRVVRPDGTSAALQPTYGRDLALLEVDIAQPGTYRISSGQREGRTSRAVIVNGEWKFLAPNEAPPAGTRAVDVKSMTKAETFVTRGKPTQAALSATGKGLEFRPTRHPNELFVGTEATFEVLLDGKPLANQKIDVYFDGQRYADQKVYASKVSDAAGVFSVKLDRAGVYLAMTRHRAPASAPEQPAMSHTYSVTFEATD